MNRNSNYNRDPRIIQARFETKCDQTGELIRKGQDCVWYPVGKKIYSMTSDQALEFMNWQADLAMGFDY